MVVVWESVESRQASSQLGITRLVNAPAFCESINKCRSGPLVNAKEDTELLYNGILYSNC